MDNIQNIKDILRCNLKAAIIQSNYLPWKGYFDIIHDVDTFVFLEDVQYTRRDWRNRNKVKTPGGVKWISVPVTGRTHQKIHETSIDYSQDWRENHKSTIHHSYASAPYYDSYEKDILQVYSQKFSTISELNIHFIKKISNILSINTCFVNSIELESKGVKEEKLIEICHKIGADQYLSGPAGKNYIDEEKFKSNGIALQYKDYSGYPQYPQLWGDFQETVSIIDVIFNCGEKASEFIWGWKNE